MFVVVVADADADDGDDWLYRNYSDRNTDPDCSDSYYSTIPSREVSRWVLEEGEGWFWWC